jgi:hypothetical protein
MLKLLFYAALLLPIPPYADLNGPSIILELS